VQYNKGSQITLSVTSETPGSYLREAIAAVHIIELCCPASVSTVSANASRPYVADAKHASEIQ
jgi:hypothetical protein